MDVLRLIRASSAAPERATPADPGGASRPMMRVGFGVIVLLLMLALALTGGVLELKSGLRAYVTGESLWSKGKQDAVYYLDRFAETGEGDYLHLARQGLAVPLGDRRARLAMEASPPDPREAEQGFLQGGNHPDDVGRLIWLFRHFSEVSYFRDAVEIWREADHHILRLEEIADKLVAQELSGAELRAIRGELLSIQQTLQPLEQEFSHTLGEADRWLNGVLFTVVAVVLGLAAVLAMVLFWWTARSLALSERELRVTLENAGVGMALLCGNGVIRSVNSRFRDILGYPDEQVIGRSLIALPGALPNERLGLEQVLAELRENGSNAQFERRWRRADGQLIQARFNFNAVTTGSGRARYFIMVLEDITEQHSREEQLSWEATHDPLTGLFNRREFERRLHQAMEGVERDGARHVLCFIDLDYFKQVNDNHGHMAGDTFLVRLCELLRRNLREGDVLARLGGDEFAVIFHHCPMDVAREIGEGIRTAVEAYRLEWEGARLATTVSVGLVGITGGHTGGGSLLKEADRACYSAKRGGRNRVYVVSVPGGDEERTASGGRNS